MFTHLVDYLSSPDGSCEMNSVSSSSRDGCCLKSGSVGRSGAADGADDINGFSGTGGCMGGATIGWLPYGSAGIVGGMNWGLGGIVGIGEPGCACTGVIGGITVAEKSAVAG